MEESRGGRGEELKGGERRVGREEKGRRSGGKEERRRE